MTFTDIARPMWNAGRILFVAVIVLCLLPGVQAQAPAGYTKIASVTTTTYTDTAGLAAGQVNNYVVTATDAAGESGPSNIVVAITPNNSNPHSNALTWTAATGGSPATGFNVYRQLVTPPNPAGGLAVVSQ